MEILLSAEQIRQRIGELGTQINHDYEGKPFIVIAILTGSVVFLADLVRQIEHSHQIGLIRASSYPGTATTAGELIIEDHLLPDIRGRAVLLLDDILDTGQTLSKIIDHLTSKGATEVRSCVLLHKIGRQTVAISPDYRGFEIPNEFVIGYGLDYNDHYRHLPYIGILPEEWLETTPEI